MKFLKSHFALSKSQQNGIFVLVILIILFQVIIFTDLLSKSEAESINPKKIENFRSQLDSLNKNTLQVKDTIFPFNPNFITDFKGYQLGMSTEEIDRLLAFRNSGKWINNADDFKSVTGISDSLLDKMRPSFRFPEWTKKGFMPKVLSKEFSTEVSNIDINLANAEDFETINGIGEVLSERIVKYRSSIGGFLSTIQLKDVYGLSPEVIARIEDKFQVVSKPNVVIRNLNSISAEELTEIPYFNARLAKEIITYRKLHEGISSFDELSKINAFPSDKIDRIKLYLTIE